jgi:hypothetical protein
MWQLPEAAVLVYATIVEDLIFLQGAVLAVLLPTEVALLPGAV